MFRYPTWLFVAFLAANLAFVGACGGDEGTSTINNQQGTPDADNGTPDSDDGTPDAGNNNTPDTDTCSGDQQMCGGQCVDTATNASHCGSCDTACAGGPNTVSTCAEGACETSCEAGYQDNDGDLADPDGNGCELGCEPTNGGTEICDGVDNDCDGSVDEDFNDLGDDCSVGAGACASSGQYVCNADGSDVECNASAGEPSDEFCADGIDNDCDGDTDEDDAADAPTWYRDNDEDGFGDTGNTQTSCQQPTGFVDQDGDCDDGNAQRNPDAQEVCDSVDNNCDGNTDEAFADKGQSCTVGQGVCQNSGTYVCTNDHSGVECNAAAGSPTEPGDEQTCDDLDNNCDGMVDEGCDDDDDGWCDDAMDISGSPAVCSAGTNSQDCDDTEDTAYPGAPGLCDDIDNDCDGSTDEIEVVNTNPSSYELFGSTDGQTPAKTMAVPADGDSFCVATLSNGYLQMNYVDAAGNRQKAKRDLIPQCRNPPPYCIATFRSIMDVGWNGTSCAALVKSTSFGSSLDLARWDPGASDIQVIDVNDDDTYAGNGGPPSDSETHLNAALYSYTPQNCSFFCGPIWIVAYYRTHPTNDGNYQVVYRKSLAGFDDGSVMDDAYMIDSFASKNGELDIGPSPNENDVWMVIWDNSSEWQAKTKADGGGLSNVRSSLDVSDDDGPYATPQLYRIDGTSYLAMYDTGSDAVRLRVIESNYSYGRETTIASAPSDDFIGRHMMTDDIGSRGWTVRPTLGGGGLPTNYAPAGWYADPYGDHLNQIGEGSTLLGGNPILGDKRRNNSNRNYSDEYLAARTTGDYLQIIRLTDDDPTTVAVDELTCY